MNSPHPARRWAARASTAALALLALAGGVQAVAAVAPAAAAARSAGTAARPTSGAIARQLPPVHRINLRAAYQRALPQSRAGRISGIVYPKGRRPTAANRPAVRVSPAAAQPAAGNSGTCTEPNCPLVYHGGVVQQSPAVYLLLWGPHWGSSRSQRATARYLERFYQGLSMAPQDTWSTITSQYGGSDGFPDFGNSVFMGTYADTSTPPRGVREKQFNAEANAFATTHGLVGDVNVQIVIATQSATCPSGFYAPGCANGSGYYCAWHSSSSQTGVTYTNLPYLLNAGASCGENIIRSKYDGFSIVGGHEYAESVTDPVPPTGWIDQADTVSGGEIGDKCAWYYPGTETNDIATVTLSTGTFAMQPLFSNNALASSTRDGCAMYAPAMGNTVTVTNPGSRTTTTGTAVSLQVQAADSGAGMTLGYSAIGLPAGLSMNPATGLISGNPTRPGSTVVKIIASDPSGASGSAIFAWTIRSTCPAAQLLKNPGFETGRLAPWKATRGVLKHTSRRYPAHSGKWLARLDGRGTRHTDRLSQKVAIPAGCTRATFSFWLKINSNDPHRKAYDTLKVQVLATDGRVLATLHTYSNRNRHRYRHHSFPVSSFAGRKVVLKFTGRETLRHHDTSFFIDATALKVT